MSDLISRQAAIDELGEKPLAWTEGEYELGLQQQWEADVNAIKALPSEQQEIIRCKDCEHWDTSWQNDYAPNYHYCPLVDGTRRDDFYCADAERRTDG